MPSHARHVGLELEVALFHAKGLLAGLEPREQSVCVRLKRLGPVFQLRAEREERRYEWGGGDELKKGIVLCFLLSTFGV